MTAINRNKNLNRKNTDPVTVYKISPMNSEEIKAPDLNEVIYSFYCDLSSLNYARRDDFPVADCFVLKLSKFILDLFKDESIRETYEHRTSDIFYDLCLERLVQTETVSSIDDDELIVIYLKQCVALLRDSEILFSRRADSMNDSSLYKCLFNSFWNTIAWEDIFPSDPEGAVELKRNRNIFLDLLNRRQNSVSIETLANEFLELTGISEKNDLFMISFIDFYLLTWLNHFGIVDYIRGSIYSPVMIRVTDMGRRISQYLPIPLNK